MCVTDALVLWLVHLDADRASLSPTPRGTSARLTLGMATIHPVRMVTGILDDTPGGWLSICQLANQVYMQDARVKLWVVKSRKGFTRWLEEEPWFAEHFERVDDGVRVRRRNERAQPQPARQNGRASSAGAVSSSVMVESLYRVAHDDGLPRSPSPRSTPPRAPPPRAAASPPMIELKPRNDGQMGYIDALGDPKKSVVICFGKAGTGKTLLAVAGALKWLRAAPPGRPPRRIILTRPPLLAGGVRSDDLEKLCKPALDLLDQHAGKGAWQRLREQKRLELIHLHEMRGQTHDHSYVIVDEAQNSTPHACILTWLAPRPRPHSDCHLCCIVQ